MKMVKFSYGKYAVRKLTSSGYRYKSLGSNDYWWAHGEAGFDYCIGDYDSVKNMYLKLTDKGKPIDVNN